MLISTNSAEAAMSNTLSAPIVLSTSPVDPR
jgi:hypothetical protein